MYFTSSLLTMEILLSSVVSVVSLKSKLLLLLLTGEEGLQPMESMTSEILRTRGPRIVTDVDSWSSSKTSSSLSLKPSNMKLFEWYSSKNSGPDWLISIVSIVVMLFRFRSSRLYKLSASPPEALDWFIIVAALSRSLKQNTNHFSNSSVVLIQINNKNQILNNCKIS